MKNILTIKNIRWICYGTLSLLIFIPNIPFPFSAEVLHEIFGGQFGGLVTFATVALLLLFIFICFIYIVYELVRHKKFNKDLALELIIIPLLFFAIIFGANYLIGDKDEYLFAINNGKNTDDFRNPFLSYKMLDCRKFTDDFDVIFVPRHLLTETEYLAYSPKRADKSNGYRFGKKFNDDWYLEFSGSQWDDAFRTCYFQGKNPF